MAEANSYTYARCREWIDRPNKYQSAPRLKKLRYGGTSLRSYLRQAGRPESARLRILTSVILKSLNPFEQVYFYGTGRYETNCIVLSFQPLDLREDGCERSNLRRATPIPEAGAKAGAGIPALSRLGADGASRFV